ncbi:2-phospho-L-lactate guanylyltransferase [Halopenitus persicus]|uniref:2-phospho-L-lactate guanylyltransferase n=1 Tax=Halopenitus persicus TaxID=1048396 RepID=A0A1H3KI43_9EURY|nr:2-phospho-L-lactate guanylyltransferase [Halopenitus persicus]SDY51719.1 phospholactate guanylyltransferase [Halopenitus persicus]
MDVLVPFAADRPKTRLSDTFTPAERRAFADAMLRDVLRAVREADGEPTVLADRPIDLADRVGADLAATAAVRVDDRELTPAVSAAITDAFPGTVADPADAIAVVMGDLAIATPRSLERLFDATGDVVLAPGRGGGTNALVVRDPAFRVDYHGASVRDHRRAARSIDASLTEIDSYRLGTDVDERDDLAEVLLHGTGTARRWLSDAGFELRTADGRVTVERTAVE